MKKTLLSIGLMAMLLCSLRGFAQTTYTMITSASGLEVGASYLLVGFDDEGNAYAMSYQKSNNRHAVAISEAGGVVTATVATDPSNQTDPYEITLGGAAGAWTLEDPVKGGFLNAPGGGNYLKTQTELSDNGKWDITFDANGGGTPVSNGAVEQKFMRFNLNASNGTPLFGCYKESSSIVAPVYFFKAGGQAEPDPEPTSYPTNFVATVNTLSVTLTWNDATGEQLPAKYLVLGSKGNITIPVDGTPVANAELATNVNYGTQSVTFNNLDGNSTYHFAIFPYTNAGASIDYKTDGSYPSVNAQTPDVVALLNETFDNDLGVFTTFDVYGDQTWRQASYNNNGYANMNGYANQVYNENEDWLISPAMNGEYASVVMSFSTAMKFEGEALQVMISSDYDGVSEPSDYSWENITDAFDFSTGNYEWVESGEVSVESLTGETFHVAFVYASTAEAAAAWEVDNVLVMAQTPTAVNEQTSAVVLYPNPANDRVAFKLSQDAVVALFDMNGRMLAEKNFDAGMASCEVSNLENGVYFVNFRFADGSVTVTKFVKM